jgi:2-octaprenyl-6-methoxyphenol hydroxylase
MTLTQDFTALASFPQPETTPQMATRLDYDLVIVGGGLVGMTLACALQDSGLRMAVIEAQPESAAIARGQAYHINLMSSQIFEGIGVWSDMRPHVNPIEQIHLSDADFSQSVKFGPRDLAVPVLGYVAEHRVVLAALQERLRTAPNVTQLCPVEVVQRTNDADGAILEVKQAGERRHIRTRLVVAADGRRSPLRQAAGIQTLGWQYWQSCVVAFIQPERPHQNIAYERFWPSGPFAILPLPENLCRIVWTAPKAEAEAILALDDDQFLALLRQRYGSQMGELTLVGQRSLFPVYLMHSQQYTQPRLALMGDAAHCCHPVGGQGVNLGIRDAAVLAEVLQAAHANGQDIGDRRLLRRYERRRLPENLVILSFTDFLDRLFSNTWLPTVLLRRLGLVVLRSLPPLKTIALRLMTGLVGKVPAIAHPKK